MQSQAQADPKATIICGQARFTILTDRLLRLEWAADGLFEDRPTFAACNRRLPVPAFRCKQAKTGCVIETGALKLEWKGGKFSPQSLRITLADGTSWRFGATDARNLGGTHRTLDMFKGNKKEEWAPGPLKTDPQVRTGRWVAPPLPQGLISRAGWSVHDDSAAPVFSGVSGAEWVEARPDGERYDLYFLGYGQDYRACLRDAAQIFGRQRMPPRYAFGYWYSRYWCYTDRELEQVVDDFDRRGLPIDVLVVDMDWHKPGWTGYSFDTDCFPDPASFLARLKKRGLKITFNLHPADGVGEHEDMFGAFRAALPEADKRLETLPAPKPGKFQVAQRRFPFAPTDPAFMRAYFDVLHRPLEKMGVDFWWMDWQQGSSTSIRGLDPLTWLNLLHWRDQETNPERHAQRPLIFSRFGGLGSGRYPVGFSGDTIISWESLAYQPEFTATAANVLFGYWSHDIGGHMDGPRDGELYSRWMQYGIFSPILRTHSSKGVDADRRFWTFPDPWCQLLEQALIRRYELVPVVAAASKKAWDTGLSLCRPLYLHYPALPEAYHHADEYFFGDDLLCAPVLAAADPDTLLTNRPLWLPPGSWFDTARSLFVEGGKHTPRYTADEIPVFVQPGAVICEQVAPKRLEPGSYPCPRVVCYPGGKGAGTLYEDDGVSEGYRDGQFVEVTATQRATASAREIVLAPAAGKFPGFQRKRPLELLLPAVLPPQSVCINGKELPWNPEKSGTSWSWDGDAVALRIHLAQVDLGATTTISIRGVKAAPDGLAALLRRLVQLMHWTKASSPCWAKHAEERLPIRLGHTGYRIALNPGSAKAEIAALRNGLPRLDAIIQVHEAAMPNSNWPRARRLLAAICHDYPQWFRRKT